MNKSRLNNKLKTPRKRKIKKEKKERQGVNIKLIRM